jgi:DNA-binding transcriptional ArsR family regulator
MDELEHPDLASVSLEQVLTALGDPTRLEIFRKLLTEGCLPCGALVPGGAKSTTTHHCRVLREAGLTRTKICGTQRLLRVPVEDLETRFPGLLALVKEG